MWSAEKQVLARTMAKATWDDCPLPGTMDKKLHVCPHGLKPNLCFDQERSESPPKPEWDRQWGRKQAHQERLLQGRTTATADSGAQETAGGCWAASQHHPTAGNGRAMGAHWADSLSALEVGGGHLGQTLTPCPRTQCPYLEGAGDQHFAPPLVQDRGSSFKVLNLEKGMCKIS